MLAPLSWLKEYVDITFSPEELGERLTEIGLGTEKIEKTKDDVIFDLEITPNRPDLLSMMGIAREIAAIEKKSVKEQKGKIDLKKIKPSKILPIKIQTDYEINPRFTAIIISGIEVKDSPKWLSQRLIKIGQRPINNIVDITNYVMFELGNPIHAFDYDKIKGKTMKVHKTRGGENFKSVDGISYHLLKGAVVISDNENIIDLCGIKGGFNSGTFEDTKTIFIRVPVEKPNLIRRASQSLGLRSEASSIFERGVNAGGTDAALERCVDLILEIAGGEIASPLYDLKKQNFSPWKVNLNLQRLSRILGINISEEEVLNILKSLNLSPRSQPKAHRPLDEKDTIETVIPTYRNDLKIEEDIIEEVARIYGYNKFPKTIPAGEIPIKIAPYFRNYRIDEKVKNILKAAGFSEVYTYSLISEKDLVGSNLNPDRTLRVDNPVSREFEYLRPTLKINLLKALVQNKPYFENINLFELGKVYLGPTLDSIKEEWMLAGISNSKNFYEIKGILERLIEELGVKKNISKNIEATGKGILFEISFDALIKDMNVWKKFRPLPKYPPVIEDITIRVSEEVKVGDVISIIKDQNNLVKDVDVLDKFKKNVTFRIVYQSDKGNLTKEEVSKIREKIYKALYSNLKVEII